MLKTEDRLIVSPTDLVGFLACDQRARLDWMAARDGIKPPFDGDPVLDLVNRKGREHEARYLEGLRAKGLNVVDLSNLGNKAITESAAAELETVQAMRGGADVVYQGVLFDGQWRGRPDFLVKVDAPSSFGSWSYEVADTKLAREVKAGAIVQLVMYSLRLAELQGVAPREMRVITGVSEEWRFRADDYTAYVRVVRDRFLTSLLDTDPLASSYPHPVEHCRVCNWAPVCIEKRRADDHTSLVAGMTRSATRKLVEAGITTTASLGRAVASTEVKDLAKSTFARLQAQAALQLKQRTDGVVRFELIEEALRPPLETPATPPEKPPTPLGLAALPLPTADDLFFDIEADPWAGEGAGRGDGLEYLFGVLSLRNGSPVYEPLWAHSAEEEKAMLEAFIDRCRTARSANPGFHVYHYGAYEVSALQRLAGRYGTRDLDLAALQRGEVFVDLYSVVKQGIRISQESYSLKKIEALYMPHREGPITRGGFSVVEYERWLEDRDQKHLDDLAAYNRDDCVSTWKLRNWLEARRAEAERLLGVPIPRPESKSMDEEVEAAEETAANQGRINRLRNGVSVVAAERDAAGEARWRLSSLLDFHRRESSPQWWRWFDLKKKSPEELAGEPDALGEMVYTGIVGTQKRSTIYRYLFDPAQDQKFNIGDKPVDPATGEGVGTITSIDATEGVVDLKRGNGSRAPHPAALIPSRPMNTIALRMALARLADDVIERGAEVDAGPWRAARAFLLRLPPRLDGSEDGAPIRRQGETASEAAVRAILDLRHSCLAIQGPPGTGKTWTAAQAVLALHAAGKRVALTGPSYKVIANLIRAVLDEAELRGTPVEIVQIADENKGVEHPRVTLTDAKGLVSALDSGSARISAGTAWPYASQPLEGLHDVLFVDEAGQFSMANACAASGTAAAMVLIGDPNQLSQVTQGTHPDGAGLSALEHVLNGGTTLSEEQGLFLDQTRRMHPDLCELISDVFYAGRLSAHQQTHQVRINGPAPLGGTGLRLHVARHLGCASRSYEEVSAVVDLLRDLLGRTWVDKDGATKPIEVADVLIVAPFNSQVVAIREGVQRELGVVANVGTVDKFQGQQGAVVLYSMTCSSAEEAPRGMEFLYSPNRLNVSVSRAKALAVIIYNPDLLRVQCRTPEQMRLANALCRVVDSALPSAGQLPLL